MLKTTKPSSLRQARAIPKPVMDFISGRSLSKAKRNPELAGYIFHDQDGYHYYLAFGGVPIPWLHHTLCTGGWYICKAGDCSRDTSCWVVYSYDATDEMSIEGASVVYTNFLHPNYISLSYTKEDIIKLWGNLNAWLIEAAVADEVRQM